MNNLFAVVEKVVIKQSEMIRERSKSCYCVVGAKLEKDLWFCLCQNVFLYGKALIFITCKLFIILCVVFSYLCPVHTLGWELWPETADCQRFQLQLNPFFRVSTTRSLLQRLLLPLPPCLLTEKVYSAKRPFFRRKPGSHIVKIYINRNQPKLTKQTETNKTKQNHQNQPKLTTPTETNVNVSLKCASDRKRQRNQSRKFNFQGSNFQRSKSSFFNHTECNKKTRISRQCPP